MINAQLIKQLRDLTQAGMLDCKKALEANDGNVEKAVVWLREKELQKLKRRQQVVLQLKVYVHMQFQVTRLFILN